MKVFKSKVAIIASFAVTLALSAFGASARESAHLWKLEITTAQDDADMTTIRNWSCMADSDWRNPPESLTGKQCPAQTFTRQGDTLSWTVSCDAVQGEGKWAFSDNDKAVEGQSKVTFDGATVVTGIAGEAVDKCSL